MKKKIMIVDDEIEIRKSVKRVLENEGYVVITANNGKDCLTKLKKIKPDLILLDIIMPGFSIEKTVKSIKDIKIVFLSGVDFSEKEEKMMKQKNVVGFINKPVSIKNLIDNVEKFSS